MNGYTRLSEKGQVVVPKATRDRLGWLAGLDLEVIEGPDSVTFRHRGERRTLSVEEAVARFRQIYQHQGPPVPLEQMKQDAQEAAAKGMTDE